MSDQTQQPEQPQVVQVELGFMQAIVNYLATRPYGEVHQFMDVLVKNNQLPQPQTQEQGVANLQEVPEGFDPQTGNDIKPVE